MLDEHLLLAQLAHERSPDVNVTLVHRMYRLHRGLARKLFGDRAAATVPAEGLTDVHTYAVADLNGRRVTLDVTFPGCPPWNGSSDMQLACAAGDDYPAGDDPLASKRELVERFCDPAAREPFIAALGDR